MCQAIHSQRLESGMRGSAPVRRSDRETIVTLRLPRELHERLKQEGGERGLTAEVRRRLEASFAPSLPDWSESDPKTRELSGAIPELARLVQDEYGPWHSDPGAFHLFELMLGH